MPQVRSSFAIRAYHRGEGHFVSWHIAGRSIGLTKQAERAVRFGTPEAASAMLDGITRLRGIATVVELARPYWGVGLIDRDAYEVVLGWSQPQDIGMRVRARVTEAGTLLDCGDIAAEWISALTGADPKQVWSRTDAVQRAEARGTGGTPNAHRATKSMRFRGGAR